VSRRARWLVGLAFAVLVVLLAGGTAVGFYAELAWFGSLGYEDRFWKLELAQVASWLLLFLGAAGAVGWALRYVVHSAGPVQVRRQLGDLEIAEALPDSWVSLATGGAAVFAGLLVAGPFAEPLARQTLFALEATPWGSPEPILDRDPRFYVFHLPLLRTVWSALVAVVTWVGLGLGAVLLLTGRIRATEQGVVVDEFARRQAVYLGVAALLLASAHFGLSMFELVGGGPVGYAEVHGEIPARRLMAILTLLAAGALLYGRYTASWRPALTALAVAGVAWPVGTMVYPETIQRFRVEPNELELERPYIGMQVEATRSAFGLDEIRRVAYDVTDSAPSAEKIRRHTSGLPLWDERPLKATYDQLQGLVAFHEFPGIDPDRYGQGDDQQQVAIGIREFAPSRLAASARTWQNLHLRYTHGQGWVVTAVDRATEGGEPHYYVRDLPPRMSADAPAGLELTEPKVYFGELTSQYVMMPPDSFPDEGRPTGVDLDNVVERAVMAWALESKNLLLRNPGRGTPLLMWRRQVVERVRSLVPFLLVDSDVYPVVHEGRIVWIVELLAGSRRYPLSERTDAGGTSANYLRSVGKAVVDGVTGEVDLYTVDPDEPLLATYRRTFPDLFRPLDEMPPGLRSHLRYPRSLFRAQSRVLEAYHLTEPEEFYQRQGLWSLGQEVYDQRAVPVEPYFLLMPFPGRSDTARAGAGLRERPPGSAEQEFVLTTPFTPHNRDNLSSFLMARNDGEHYGELWLFELSGQRQVFGPRQVEVQIDQDPVISQQLSLWQQLGSRAIRGHLLLVPVDGYLVYVEPLFLVAEDREGAAPGLKRVIAAAGDRVAMGLTLDDALERLLGERPRAAPMEADGDVSAVDTAAGAEAGTDGDAGQTRTLQRVRELLRQADRALQEGNLARFGEIWQEIRRTAGPGGGPSVPGDTVGPDG
jgi:uncharacterized membrane protein (UPF0182 family)